MIKLKENYVRKALFFCKLALTLLLLLMLVRMFLVLGGNSVVFTPAAVSAAEDVTDAIGPESSHNLQDYTAIVSNNIFGISGAASDESNSSYHNGSAGPLDERLGIALLGTLAGSPTLSRAIIKDLKTSSVGLYKIGDTIATATIESIERECVVLSDHGSRKTLYLGIETKNTGPKVGRFPTGLPANQDITENQPAPVSSPAADQSSNRDVKSILADVVIEPHRVNDEVDGLKISGLDNVPEAKALGLQDGDIIQVVNGQSVTSKQQAFQILKKARSQDSVNIELMRDNKVKTLFFPLTDKRRR